MVSQLMMQELEHIQNMIKECRVDLPEEFPPNLVDGFRIDWHEAKLKSLREKRANASNWRKSSLDERISEREKRLQQAKRDAASDSSQRANLLSGAFSERVQELEQIYT